MKRNIIILFIVLCLAGSSSAFARGSYRSHYDGYNSRHHSNHYSRSYNYGYRDRSHRHDLGTFIAVAGGLILFSALVNSAQPAPSREYYRTPYRSYEPALMPQPRVCFETRRVSGELQVNPYDGSQVWVPFAYPLLRRIQVPCY